jgi:hypothetical protein
MTATTAEWRKDQLLPVSRAAAGLGRSADALRDWISQGWVPAVQTPGGQWNVYASWMADVLDSARPGRPGDMAEVTRQWWLKRGITEGAAA